MSDEDDDLEDRHASIQADNDLLRQTIEAVRQDLRKLEAKVRGMERLAKGEVAGRC